MKSRCNSHGITERIARCRRFVRRFGLLVLFFFFAAIPASAQEMFTDLPAAATGAASATPLLTAGQSAASQTLDGRACDGCPRRHVGRAFLDELLVNFLYGGINLARGQVTGRISPQSWWENMRRGWEWDLDDFQVNQFGHPYQGSNYFNSGRANGLSFWESAGLAAFGSGTWEYFGETNRASLNDFINTTLGGVALGETFHRLGWLIRRPNKVGFSRLMTELGALPFDPVTSLQRLATGEARQVSGLPPEGRPASLSVYGSSGWLWRGSNVKEIEATQNPFFEANFIYGDAVSRTARPFDHFELRFDFGGGAGLSEIRLRGDLVSARSSGGIRRSVLQSYHYAANTAYRFGAQSVLGGLSIERPLGARLSWSAGGTAGITVLGAVDSLPPGVVIAPPSVVDPNAGQGISTGPRNYDYGPGTNFGGQAALFYRGQPLMTGSFEAQHLYTIDGVRANHLLQRARLTVGVPLVGGLGIGAHAEYFDRRTFYRTNTPDAHFRFPQYRAAVTWDIR